MLWIWIDEEAVEEIETLNLENSQKVTGEHETDENETEILSISFQIHAFLLPLLDGVRQEK